MGALRRGLARLAAAVRGHGEADDDLRAEMDAHLAMEVEENLRRGMEPGEARRRALIASGGLDQAAEIAREQRGLPWMETSVADLRYAARRLRHKPFASAVMVLVLSVGIGTNTLLVTVLDSVTTMPAAGIPRDESLVRLRGTLLLHGAAGPQPRPLSWTEIQAFAERRDLFEGVAAYAERTALVDLGETQTPVAARVVYVSSNYFPTLGLQPSLGTYAGGTVARLEAGASPTVVVGHAWWRQRLGGTSAALGRALRVNATPVEVVGVAPPHFVGTDGGSAPVLWAPLGTFPLLNPAAPESLAAPDSLPLSAVARLAPGVSLRTAASALAAMAPPRASVFREPGGAAAPDAGSGVDLVPLLAGNARPGDRSDLLASGILAGGLGLLVLLITCTNVGGLLAGMAVVRRKEIAVRLSLGASRGRVVRQLLAESLLLAMLAGAVALAVTSAGVTFVGAGLESLQLDVNLRVTLATFAAALLTGVIFGLSPSLHATRVSLDEVLRGSAAALSPGGSGGHRALVVGQIALTFPLLMAFGAAATVLATDLGRLAPVEHPDRIVEIEIDVWAGQLANDDREARIAALVERLRALPEVVAAAPLQMGTVTVPLTVHPADRVPGVRYDSVMQAHLVAAPEGHAGVFGRTVTRGRDFDSLERTRRSNDALEPATFEAVVLDSGLARRLWGGADPLGRRLNMVAGTSVGPMEVVGVIAPIGGDPRVAQVYVPYAPMNTGVVLRTRSPALPMIPVLRGVVAEVFPQLPIVRAETLEEQGARLRRDLVRGAGAASAGGVLALLLSAMGLYGVVSLAVTSRAREVGIRMALGARRGQVVRGFVARGLVMASLGLMIGGVLTALSVRVLEGVVPVPLPDVVSIGGAVAGVVILVASIAVGVPSSRAAAIDPMAALRPD